MLLDFFWSVQGAKLGAKPVNNNTNTYYYYHILIFVNGIHPGIHLDHDTWIVPGQIPVGKPPRDLGNSYKPAGTEVVDLSCRSQHPTAIYFSKGPAPA